MAGFRDLRVWQVGMRIVGGVQKVTARFPGTGVGGLKAQMRRAAISIPSNIAEGSNRGHDTELRRFLGIALGSCGELETQLELAHQLEYSDEQRDAELVDQIDHEGRMLRRLIQRLSE